MTEEHLDQQGETFNAYRNGRVHVLNAKCATCIFRPGNLMHLADGRRDDMVHAARADDTAIICHATLPDDVDNAICRGFYDIHGRDVATLRLAQLANVITWQDQPS